MNVAWGEAAHAAGNRVHINGCENNIHSGPEIWEKCTPAGGEGLTQRAMVSAIISSSALLSLGVMEHWNGSGRLEAVSFLFFQSFLK